MALKSERRRRPRRVRRSVFASAAGLLLAGLLLLPLFRLGPCFGSTCGAGCCTQTPSVPVATSTTTPRPAPVTTTVTTTTTSTSTAVPPPDPSTTLPAPRASIVTFDFDEAIVPRNGVAEIEAFVARLRDPSTAGKRISVVGHTCILGPVPRNQALSERRARAVVAILRGRLSDPLRNPLEPPVGVASAQPTSETQAKCHRDVMSAGTYKDCLRPDRRAVITLEP